MRELKLLVLLSTLFVSVSTLHTEEIEEVVVTGSLLKDPELDASPVEQISVSYTHLTLPTICRV